MNCQDHLYRNANPKHLTRRWFLQECGVGLGAVALGHLLGRAGYAAHVARHRQDDARRRTGAPAGEKSVEECAARRQAGDPVRRVGAVDGVDDNLATLKQILEAGRR